MLHRRAPPPITTDDAGLSELQANFFEKHCHTFDDDADNEDVENKLEYTDIFREYTTTLEQFLTERLKAVFPWFSMSEFMGMIKDREEQAFGDVFDVLLSLADFLAFKSCIMDYKRVACESW